MIKTQGLLFREGKPGESPHLRHAGLGLMVSRV